MTDITIIDVKFIEERLKNEKREAEMFEIILNLIKQLEEEKAKNGKFLQIKEIIQKCDMPPCLEQHRNCKKCKDNVTENGSRCMQYGIEKILQILKERG